MDIFTIIGFAFSIGFTLLSILTSGSFGAFIDIPSILFVVGGTLGSMFVSSRGKNAKQFFKLVSLVLKEPKVDNITLINTFVGYSSKARSESLLSLEHIIQTIEDPFIKKGMMMIVDGVDSEVIKKILGLKMKGISERHKNNRAIFDTGAALAPAFGMIATLIGLVNMLKSLSDPSSIGPLMSMALLTTFYGSLLTNVFFIPISKKLKARTAEELFQKELILEALLSIQFGESPSVMKGKLVAYLSDKESMEIDSMINQDIN